MRERGIRRSKSIVQGTAASSQAHSADTASADTIARTHEHVSLSLPLQPRLSPEQQHNLEDYSTLESSSRPLYTMSIVSETRWGSPSASKSAVLLHGLTSASPSWFKIARGLVDAGELHVLHSEALLATLSSLLTDRLSASLPLSTSYRLLCHRPGPHRPRPRCPSKRLQHRLLRLPYPSSTRRLIDPTRPARRPFPRR